MAATVLIGVMILSLGVYLFSYFGNYAKGVEDENRTNQIAQFNSQFLSYQGKDMTFYDVLSLANMAKDYNNSNDSKKGDVAYISLSISSTGEISPINNFEQNVSSVDINNYFNYIYINEQNGELRKYRLASYTVNDITRYINTITIQNIK